MYTPLRPAQSQTLAIRNLSYHVRTWGQAQPEVPPLVLVHGWMDVGASWQFVVDALSTEFAQQRLIIAPDWRGFGRTRAPAGADSFWFPDYVADLDALVQHFAPEGQAIDLVGHSMGGNVAMMYAGARPERVRHLVNLEGFGLAATEPAQAPRRMQQWLDELQHLHAGKLGLKTYASDAEVAQRLRKTNPRLPEDKALWLARHWAAVQDDGRWAILGHAAHKVVNPQLFRVDEILAYYRAITAPTLAVHASDDSLGGWWKGKYTLEEYHQRLQSVPQRRIVQVDDAGHMLHHDQPQVVAQLIENFCSPKAPATTA